MPSANKFDICVDAIAKKQINFNTDTFKILLTDTLPVRTNAVTADITQISGTAGYTTGGLTVTPTLTTSSGTESLAIANLVVTSTGSMGNWRYPVLVNTTANVLMWWWDVGSEVTLASGATETISFGTTTLI